MSSHSSHPNDEPVVLSWNPEPQRSNPIAPGEIPPSYDVARIPNVPTTFLFSLMGANTSAMLLIPSMNSPETRPLYHISAGIDPFLPTRMVTTVLKGANDQGQYVGGFKTVPMIQAERRHPAKIGDSSAAAYQTVTVRGKEIIQSAVWKSLGMNNAKKTFSWGNPRKMIPSFTWSCPMWPKAGTFTCFTGPYFTRTTYAEFTVSDPSKERVEPKLKLMPDGYQYFDEIVISILLLERDRMTSIVRKETQTPN